MFVGHQSVGFESSKLPSLKVPSGQNEAFTAPCQLELRTNAIRHKPGIAPFPRGVFSNLFVGSHFYRVLDDHRLWASAHLINPGAVWMLISDDVSGKAAEELRYNLQASNSMHMFVGKGSRTQS